MQFSYNFLLLLVNNSMLEEKSNNQKPRLPKGRQLNLTTMKRILTFSLLAVLATVIFASCSKHDHWDDGNSNKEYAYVSGYNKGYPYSIIQFSSDYTYAIIENKYDDELPKNQEELYGDFYADNQYRTVRNVSGGYNMTMRVKEDGIQTAADAKDALDFYCYGPNAASLSKKNEFISTKQDTPRKLNIQSTK